MTAGIQPRPRQDYRPARAPRLSMLDRFQVAAVFYVSAWAVSPPLFINEYGRIGTVAAVGVWLLCELARRGGIIMRPTLPALMALLYTIYKGLVTFYVDGLDAVVQETQVFVFVLFLLFFESARRQGLPKYRPVMWGLLLLMPIWIVITLGALQTDSHAARLLVRSSEEGLAFQARGVGGYGLVYGAVLMTPALIYLIANLPPLSLSQGNTRHRVLQLAQRGLLYLLAGLVGLLAIKAGYSLAVIALVLGVLAYLFLRQNTRNRWMRVTLAAFISVFVLAVSQTSLLGSALGALATVTQGTFYGPKVADIRASLEMNASTGTVYDRTERYNRSIGLFVKNPLLGTLSNRDIGKHSETLDHFAQFGIFGGLAFLYVVFAMPIMLVRASIKRPWMTGASLSFTLVLAICVFFNNIAAQFGAVAFFIFPVALTYFRQRRPSRPRASVGGLHPYGANLRPLRPKSA